MKKRMSKSLRKYIRKEKARIRRQSLDSKQEKELIDKLYKNIQHQVLDIQTNDDKGNI